MSASWWFGAGLATVVAGGAAFAWWRHRQHLAELQRRLSWSEESRFMLEKRAETVDAKLQAMKATLRAQRQALRSSRGQTALLAAAAPATPAPAAAPASSVAPPAWVDTEPLARPESHYAETMPAVFSALPHGH